MERLNVATIYPAFMGEVNCHGIGAPCTFLRLAGCNLRCYASTLGHPCDTPEALEGTCGNKMTVAEVIMQLGILGNNLVCITGGEPLRQDLTELLDELRTHDYKVVIETNGSCSISPYLGKYPGLSFVVDVKAPSTGESNKMLEGNYPVMEKDDFIKFVVKTWEDYNAARDWWNKHKNIYHGQVALGLYWGSDVSYQEVMSAIIREGLPFYLNCQQHKMCYLYDTAQKAYIDVQKIKIPRNI